MSLPFFPSSIPQPALNTTQNPEVSTTCAGSEIQEKPSSSGSKPEKGTPKVQRKRRNPLGYFFFLLSLSCPSPQVFCGGCNSNNSKINWEWKAFRSENCEGNIPLHSTEPCLQMGRPNSIVFFLLSPFSRKWLHKVVYELLSSHSTCVGMNLMLINIVKFLKTEKMSRPPPRSQTDQRVEHIWDRSDTDKALKTELTLEPQSTEC